MHEVISLLDSDDEIAQLPPAGLSALPAASASRLQKMPSTSSRSTIPDISDDDEDLFAAFPARLAPPSRTDPAPARSPPPCQPATVLRERQNQPSSSRSLLGYDDDEIVVCGVISSTTQATGGPRGAVDDDELIEVVSSTLPSAPRPVRPYAASSGHLKALNLRPQPDSGQNAHASSSRTPSYTAFAIPLDLHRPLASQSGALAGPSGRQSPDAFPGPSVRVDSAVAGLWSPGGLAAEASDDDDNDLVRMLAEIEAATAAAEARRSRSLSTNAYVESAKAPEAGAKRKKYKLDSSDVEDDAAYLQARRASSTGKARAKPAPEPGRVKGKGKGKECNVTADASDNGEMRAISAADTGHEPSPKRKRKTAEQIAFDAAAKARLRQDKAEEAARRKAEKEVFKEANKLRSRTTAMQELIIDLPRQAADSRSIVARIWPELIDRFEDSGVRLTEFQPGLLANVLRFKRELKAEYDEQSRQFQSIPTRIQQESTTILLLSAEETAAHVRDKTWLSLPSRVRTAAGLTAKGQVVLIVHGLQKYYKLEKSAAAKAYDARVRGQASTEAGSAAARRAASAAVTAAASQVSKEVIEKAMVQLQVVDSSFITRVETDKEMVDYIMSFAGDVAHRPYKLIEYSHLPFCADTAIPKGAGPSDTLCKMLATVKGVTPAMTLAVLKEFGTFRGLMDAYDRAGSDGAADMLLANLIAEHRVDGAPNARYINKAKSAQIRRMLRVEDPRALWA